MSFWYSWTMGDSKTLAGNVDTTMGAGVAVAVEVGATVGEGVGVGVSVSGAGVGVGAGLGVDARLGPTPAWEDAAAAVTGGRVAWPGACANEVEGW